MDDNKAVGIGLIALLGFLFIQSQQAPAAGMKAQGFVMANNPTAGGACIPCSQKR